MNEIQEIAEIFWIQDNQQLKMNPAHPGNPKTRKIFSETSNLDKKQDDFTKKQKSGQEYPLTGDYRSPKHNKKRLNPIAPNI